VSRGAQSAAQARKLAAVVPEGLSVGCVTIWSRCGVAISNARTSHCEGNLGLTGSARGPKCGDALGKGFSWRSFKVFNYSGKTDVPDEELLQGVRRAPMQGSKTTSGSGIGDGLAPNQIAMRPAGRLTTPASAKRNQPETKQRIMTRRKTRKSLMLSAAVRTVDGNPAQQNGGSAGEGGCVSRRAAPGKQLSVPRWLLLAESNPRNHDVQTPCKSKCTSK
jgi:hypothetical protein